MQYIKWLFQHIARAAKAKRVGLLGMTPLVVIIYITTACENLCKKCMVRAENSTKVENANSDWVIWLLGECKKIGVLYADLTGGNPLLNPKALIAGLAECKKLGIYSSITLSGPLIDTSQGHQAIRLAHLVRFSVDGTPERHDKERTEGKRDFYRFIEKGLAYAQSIGKKNVQLLFTIDPREDGNLTPQDLNSVLSLSRKYNGVLISVNFLFNESGYTWRQVFRLLWFKSQAGVQLSLGKLLFIWRGGNNIANPTCRATEDIVTFRANGKMSIPCYHSQTIEISSNGNLMAALANSYRQKIIAKPAFLLRETRNNTGKSYCQGCTLWCYMIPSFANHWSNRIVVWLHMLSGFQKARDFIFQLFGYLHPVWRYPLFKPLYF